MRKTIFVTVWRIKLTFFIWAVIFCIYGVWFVFPYISYAREKGILKVLLYPTIGLVKTSNNMVSVVILGVAGGTHEGPLLTDSIQLVAYNFRTNRVSAISIPRDIWSDEMKDKINAAYAYGVYNHNKPLYFLRPELQKITGIAPDYYLVADFDKFKQLIGYIGGINIYVERTFIDKQFPVAGHENDDCGGDPLFSCRYETVTFKQGLQHMNGSTALKFARSRNAENEEGTDFARELRQKKVQEALFKKITSANFILQRSKFIEFVDFTDRLFTKNIQLSKLAALSRTYFLNRKNIQFNSVELKESMFYVPPFYEYEGRYVLLPKDGFEKVREYVKKEMSK